MLSGGLLCLAHRLPDARKHSPAGRPGAHRRTGSARLSAQRYGVPAARRPDHALTPTAVRESSRAARTLLAGFAVAADALGHAFDSVADAAADSLRRVADFVAHRLRGVAQAIEQAAEDAPGMLGPKLLVHAVAHFALQLRDLGIQVVAPPSQAIEIADDAFQAACAPGLGARPGAGAARTPRRGGGDGAAGLAAPGPSTACGPALRQSAQHALGNQVLVG